MIKVAACQYTIELLSDWSEFVNKVTQVVEKAKQNKAQLVVLPEYAGIEVFNQDLNDDLKLFQNMQPFVPRYLELFQQLAIKHQLYIQPGTIMVQSHDKFRNRAYLFGPSGTYAFQDKLQMVATEKEFDLIEGGKDQTIFETSLGLIGVAVCYDSEFPELIRNFTRQGVKLILVPSFTPSMQSYLRIFYSCQARAIENQCYVIMSSAVGSTKIGDTRYTLEGQASIFTPVDNGFEEGRISEGKRNITGEVYATLSFDKLDEVRKTGQVQNYFDFMKMSEQKPLANQRIE